MLKKYYFYTMEVILLKSHDGYDAGSIVDVTPERANYLVRCNVAAYTEGYNVPKVQKQTKPKAPAKPKVQKQTKEQKVKLEKK